MEEDQNSRTSIIDLLLIFLTSILIFNNITYVEFLSAFLHRSKSFQFELLMKNDFQVFYDLNLFIKHFFLHLEKVFKNE